MARRPGGEAAIRTRIDAAPGLASDDAHRLAGLLEGECSLSIVPNNRDGWRCACQVSLRDDDRDTLVMFRARLGIGHLCEIPARAGSRPQVMWKVQSKSECWLLAELLDRHPFRGRKLSEYEIWRDAVVEWRARRYGLPPGGRERLRRLAHNLKAARRYRDPSEAAGPSLLDRHALHYFAGFFSGEGCLGLGPRRARVVIKLRRDDRPLLEAFRDRFGIGSVRNVETAEPWSPAAVWHVTGAQDVLDAILLLEAGGLLGRKRRQFQAWRPGAEAVSLAKTRHEAVDERRLAWSRAALRQATAYAPPGASLELEPGYSEARTAYLDVLRAWAAEVDGKLGCLAYVAARERHPDWPKRETIAFTFGGWYEALRSAGLEDRAARRPSAA